LGKYTENQSEGQGNSDWSRIAKRSGGEGREKKKTIPECPHATSIRWGKINGRFLWKTKGFFELLEGEWL